jgi:hypothetical protein
LAETGNAVEKGAGVGVLGRKENFFNGALLDEFSFEHNQNTIGKIGDYAEVVGDEEDGHAELIAEIAKEVENLGLDGDIESGGGFIGDEKFGLAGEGHGDHGALLHSAGKLVRVVVRAEFGITDTDEFKETSDFGGGARKFGLMEAQGFGDLETDGEDGVERSGGFLKDVGEFSSSGLAKGGV